MPRNVWAFYDGVQYVHFMARSNWMNYKSPIDGFFTGYIWCSNRRMNSNGKLTRSDDYESSDK